jgi:transposase
MPFREASAMDEKREFVRFATMEGANIRELCRRFGISAPTAYRWLGRYRREGLAGLNERSRRPRSSPRRAAPAIEAKVLEARDQSNNAWGGRKIRRALKDRGEGGRPGGEHDHPDPAPA